MAHVVADEILQAGLENWHFSGLEGLDFLRVGIDTNDRMPEIRETRSRHKPYVAGTDHCYMHLLPPKTAAHTVARSHNTIATKLATHAANGRIQGEPSTGFCRSNHDLAGRGPINALRRQPHRLPI